MPANYAAMLSGTNNTSGGANYSAMLSGSSGSSSGGGANYAAMLDDEHPNPVMQALDFVLHRGTEVGKSLLGNPQVQQFIKQQTTGPDFAHPAETGPALAHAGDVLMHGEDQNAEDADRASIRRGTGFQSIYQHLPHPLQGVADFGIDTLSDPTMLIGPREVKAVGALGGVARDALGSLAQAAVRRLPTRANQVAKDVGEIGTELVAKPFADLTHWGGKAHRQMPKGDYESSILADNTRAAREHQTNLLLSQRKQAIMGQLSPQDQLAVLRVVNGEIKPATPKIAAAAAGMRKLFKDAGYIEATQSGKNKLLFNSTRVGNAAHEATKVGGRVIPKEPAEELDEFEQMVPDTFAPMGEEATGKTYRVVGQKLSQYDLPEELKPFEAPAKQGVLGSQNIRQPYLPGVRENQEIADDLTRPKPFNLLQPFPAHAIQRERFKIGTPSAGQDIEKFLEPYHAAIDRRLKMSARQAAAGKMREELGVKLGEPSNFDRLFQITPRAEGEARTAAEKAVDYLSLPADITRSKVTAYGAKHGLINVPVMATMSEGLGTAAKSFPDALALMRGGSGKRYEMLKDAIEAGAIGKPFGHDNQFANIVNRTKLPVRLGVGAALGGYNGEKLDERTKPNGQLPERTLALLAGAGVGAAGGAALPTIGEHLGEFTGAMDDAARANVFRAKLAKGMQPKEAAIQTLHDMLDYAHRSPLENGLANAGVLNFTKFALGVPPAIARAAARNPRRTIALNRATGGLLTNGKVEIPGKTNDNGDPLTFNMSNPVSETVTAITDPRRYARAKASDVTRLIANAVLAAGNDKYDNYWTYHKNPLPHMTDDGLRAGYLGQAIANYGPFGVGNELIDDLGINEYTPDDAISQFLLAPTIGGYLK